VGFNKRTDLFSESISTFAHNFDGETARKLQKAGCARTNSVGWH
jgi:hypothetical protein